MFDDIDDIDLEDVQESTDEQFLHEVYSRYLRKIEHTKAQLEAAKLGGTATDDWVSRTGGFLGIARRIVKTAKYRCDELGFDRPEDWLSHMEALDDMRRREAHDAGMTRVKMRTQIAEWLMQPEQSGNTAAEIAAMILMRRYEHDQNQ